MKSLPESIEVAVSSEQKPGVGFLIKLRLGVIRKNSYSYILGPTNSEGKAWITKNELLREANRTVELALMDYVPLEHNYSGEVEVKVMTESGIRKAIEAFEIYAPLEYPEGYIEKLNQALNKSINIENLEIYVKQM